MDFAIAGLVLKHKFVVQDNIIFMEYEEIGKPTVS